MANLLDGLNPQQRCAVTSDSAVLQVLAPPGSGKTKTLTSRVAHHIAVEGLRPWNMIVCTFTIKAAREMKERIRDFVGVELQRKLILGTFHSVARRYLGTYGHNIGIPKQFGIADSKDSEAIIRRIIKKHNLSLTPSSARSRISRRKSGVVAARMAIQKPDEQQQEFEIVFQSYEDALAESKLLDYDDLLLRCVELLKKHPECVSNIQAVLIDEFQDTNHVQYELMNLFAQHRTNQSAPKITIVGDPDQSIYSFRSAEIENLHRMQARYPETQVVHLEENYRSSGAILLSAIEVIEQDKARPQKKLTPTHSIGHVPVLRTLASAAKEAAWLVAELRRAYHLHAGVLNYSDFAILLRQTQNSGLLRHIETELGRAGVPYRMVGGMTKFFERFEIRLLLDYLRVINQPDHSDALIRIINVPARGIGDGTLNGLLKESEARGKSLWHIVTAISQGNIKSTLKGQATKGLSEFASVILAGQRKLQDPSTTIDGLLALVMQKLKFETFLRQRYKDEYEDRSSSVDELVELARSGKVFAEQEEELIRIEGIDQQESQLQDNVEVLRHFLANIALATDALKEEAEGDQERVTISTIHAAKGLEWPVVFIPATYDGSIPHSRAEDTDEERRLLYVGMTRAKGLLYLSWPRKHGNSEQMTLSPFLSTPSIARYFEAAGPRFNYAAISDLARVLRRRCPSVQEAEEAVQSVVACKDGSLRLRDDYHPLDGEEPTERVQETTGSRRQPPDASWMYLNKKRRFEESGNQDITAEPPPYASSGFSSVKLQLHEGRLNLEAEKKVVGLGLHPQTRSRSSAPPAVMQKAKLAGKETITSFFKATSSTTLKMSSRTQEHAKPTKADREPQAPVSSKLLPAPDPHASKALKPTFRTPNLPSALAPKAGKPNKDDRENSRYILLSSPPLPERPPESALEICAVATTANATSIGFSTTRKDTNRRAEGAETMHQTSMQRLVGNAHRSAVKRQFTASSAHAAAGFVNKPFRPVVRRP